MQIRMRISGMHLEIDDGHEVLIRQRIEHFRNTGGIDDDAQAHEAHVIQRIRYAARERGAVVARRFELGVGRGAVCACGC
jgi:hypothetical protein